MRKIALFIIWVFVFMMNPVFGYAQTKDFVIPDSLRGMGYEQLNERLIKHADNVPLAQLYTYAILEKGKAQNHLGMMANAYLRLGILEQRDSLKLQFYKKSLRLTQGKNVKGFPAKAYIIIGDYYYDRLKFDISVENYIKALKGVDDQDMKYHILDRIASIKMEVFQYEESLQLFHQCKTYFETDSLTLKKYKNIYINTLFALQSIHVKQKHRDSAQYYYHKGLEICRQFDEKESPKYFALNLAVLDAYQKDYRQAIQGLQAIIPTLKKKKDHRNLGISYYFMGSSHMALHEPEQGLVYLLQMDSLYQSNPYFLYDERQGYDALIAYYREKGDLRKQLEFVQKTLQIDSLQFSLDKQLRAELNLQYDIPMLVEEKEKLISKLNNQTNHFRFYIIILILSILGLVVYLFIRIKRNKLYKIKYDTLISNINQTALAPEKSNIKPISKPVSNDVFEIIAYKLEKFESNKEYRDTDVTLVTLSKKFNTNTAYLSKYVNHVKNTSFSSYLIELRIQDAVDTLQRDKSIRNYTIEALSEYFGFSNRQTFSKMFYQHTGIYPSFYIRELNALKK
jgi:AraC-like DNA-binding protein